MDPSKVDFTFMRSGVGSAEDEMPLTGDEQINVMALVGTFMKNAIHTAAQYVQHAKRNVITSSDIRNALQYEVIFQKGDQF